jgi:8-oxo-dGTP pyrophosphatase MutT (NUDIX family)
MFHVAGVILVRDDGAVLMQHRDNKDSIYCPDHWCCPGGMVESDEDFRAAAKRELLEETGYTVGEMSELVEEEYILPDGQPVTRHTFWTKYDGIQEILCNEGQEMRFVHLDEFVGKMFVPGHDRLFRMAIELAAE